MKEKAELPGTIETQWLLLVSLHKSWYLFPWSYFTRCDINFQHQNILEETKGIYQKLWLPMYTFAWHGLLKSVSSIIAQIYTGFVSLDKC